ncbi:MAG: hypothetical protein ACK5MN_12280 [Lachnospiraceae bacterium]
MKIYYVTGSTNKKINLVKWPYRLKVGSSDLPNFEWEYTTVSSGLDGASISAFSRGIKQGTAVLTIKGESREAYYKAMNSFFEETERDLLNLKPGRLFINDSFLECYVVKSEKADWDLDYGESDNQITVVAEYPYWCIDKLYQVFATEDGPVVSLFLDYPKAYLYDYTANPAVKMLINTNFVASAFRMVIYGPCVNPAITVGDNHYEVATSLLENEYLVIDSRYKTIRAYTKTGIVRNEFNNQNKNYDIFEKIQVGENIVTRSALFGFDLHLMHERSEPLWM